MPFLWIAAVVAAFWVGQKSKPASSSQADTPTTPPPLPEPTPEGAGFKRPSKAVVRAVKRAMSDKMKWAKYGETVTMVPANGNPDVVKGFPAAGKATHCPGCAVYALAKGWETTVRRAAEGIASTSDAIDAAMNALGLSDCKADRNPGANEVRKMIKSVIRGTTLERNGVMKPQMMSHQMPSASIVPSALRFRRRLGGRWSLR